MEVIENRFHSYVYVILLVLFFQNQGISQLMCKGVAVLDKPVLSWLHKEELSHAKDRNLFLKLAMQGEELALQGQFEESNEFLEWAYLTLENRASSVLSKERFEFEYEIYMLLYQKALNYCYMHRPDDALVECNRMSMWLNRDSSNHHYKIEFKDEPLPHLLLGLVYEAGGYYNDAFIAYQSAYSLYQENYVGFFSITEALSLQEALLCTTYRAGLMDEFKNLEDEFKMDNYTPDKAKGGELIFIWHTGIGPYEKEEPADFEMDANNSGKLKDLTTKLTYQFGTAFEVSIRKDKDSMSSLPRGIYYARIPLQKGLNKFELMIIDKNGEKKIENIDVFGNGENQIRLFTSFEHTKIEPNEKGGYRYSFE